MTDRAPNGAASAGGEASAPNAEDSASDIIPRPAAAKPARAGVFSRLKALGDRGGEALGDQYARLAGWFLEGVERFEDESAERRYRRRLAAKSSRARDEATKPPARLEPPPSPAP